MQVQGIIPPLVTPMLADEEIDLPRLRQLIDRQLDAGVHGIFVLGTTGECYALDADEKRRVVAETVAHVNRRVPVFAGTGAETTREAIHHTRMAEREGADGVSVITPYFILPTQVEVAEHYRRVADSTRLPVILYSNPSTCGGLRIEPDTVAKLAEVPNIAAIKDSSGDLQNLIETVRRVPSTFSVLQGRDTLIAPALMFGAKGAVPASCNIVPRLLVEIYESFVVGDLPRCRSAQERLSPVRIALTMGTAPGVVKQAMELTGWPAGPSRMPILPLSDGQRGKLKAVLEDARLVSES